MAEELGAGTAGTVLGSGLRRFLDTLPRLRAAAKGSFVASCSALLGDDAGHQAAAADAAASFAPLRRTAPLASALLQQMTSGLLLCLNGDTRASATAALRTVHTIALDRMDAQLLTCTTAAVQQLG